MPPCQSDEAIQAIVDACVVNGLSPKCHKCGKTLVKIRAEGTGQPVILTTEGPVCNNCRDGNPVALMTGSPSIAVYSKGHTAKTPRASIAASGVFTLNRPAVDMFGLPDEGFLMLGWQADSGHMLVGLGTEKMVGRRHYKRAVSGSIGFQVKSFLASCKLSLDDLTPESPWTPEYDEETGLISVPIVSKTKKTK